MVFIKNPKLLHRSLVVCEWLSLLPTPIRKRIFANTIHYNRSNLTVQEGSLRDAIDRSCCWDSTPEGHEFWSHLSYVITRFTYRNNGVPGLSPSSLKSILRKEREELKPKRS